MNSFKELLEISPGLAKFDNYSRNFIFKGSKEKLVNMKRKSESIVEKHSQPLMHPKPIDIYQIYTQFWGKSSIGKNELFNSFQSTRQTRLLAYALTYKGSQGKFQPIIEMDSFHFAIELFNKNWRNSLFMILFNVFLQVWDKKSLSGREQLANLLREKVKNIQTRNRHIIAIKNNSQYYFQHDGATNLAKKFIEELDNTAEVLFNPKEVKQEILRNLGLYRTMLGHSFFSEVCVVFARLAMERQDFEDFIPRILNYLRKNNRRDVAKKCFVYMVKKADKSGSSQINNLIQQAAFELVGDPINDYEWAPWNQISEREHKALIETRGILNQRCTKQFITLFFEKILYNERRKKFWLKYAEKSAKGNVRIFCDTNQAYHFLHDERVKEIAKSRVGILSGAAGGAALIIFIHDYVLIEFGSGGNAFYAYKQQNLEMYGLQKLQRSRINEESHLGISDLKITDMPTLRGNIAEGRFIHSGEWELKLSRWLRRHVEL